MENTTIDMKTSKIFKTEVQLLIESDFEDFAIASQNLNPMLTYVRFILTDDQPNSNGQRVPQDEFENLINTGMYMPLKMAEGEIDIGHDDAKPLGVIVYLKQDGNKIRGVAALWNRERPADVSYIKQRYADGKPLDLSWEIGFDPEVSYYDEESGAYCLRGCVLRATTLVGIPAYGGRTAITEVDSSDNSMEEEKVDEEKFNELKQENDNLKAEVKQLKDEVAELKENQVTDELKEELSELRTFKEEAEAEALRQENLEKIQETFEKAGIEKDAEYFASNEEKLLGLLANDMLGFFVAEMTSQKSEDEDEANASEDIPNVGVSNKNKTRVGKLSPKELGKSLREATYEK